MFVSLRALGYCFMLFGVFRGTLIFYEWVSADFVHKPFHRGRFLEHKRLEVREYTLTRHHTNTRDRARTHTFSHIHTQSLTLIICHITSFVK
jgi:hypothetical protein